MNLFEDVISSADLFKMGMRLLRQRECSIMEIGARVLGLPYYHSSDGVAFLNVFPPAKRMRRQKTKKEMSRDPTGDSTHDNLVDTYYPNRPQELEDVSLLAFFMFYE